MHVLGDDVFDHPSVDVRQTKIAAGVVIGQLFVIESQLME